MKSPEEMAEFFKDIPEAIENTQKIVDVCNFEFELGKTKLPQFPSFPKAKPPSNIWKNFAMKGWQINIRRKSEKKITEQIEI